MARDEALAACVRADGGVIRLYRWDPPTVSFGRNQPARNRFDVDGARARGIEFVRRPTGGRAVLHDQEVTYAAIFPKRAFPTPRDAYRSLHRGLALGLGRLDVDARVVGEGEGRVLPPDAGPCFRAPAPGELVVGGRKVVGSAQVRIGEAILQHGSILMGGSQEILADLGDEAQGSDLPPVTLSEILGGAPDAEDLMAAVRSGLEAHLGGEWKESDFTDQELAEAESLLPRYRSEAWTWRR
jgi:lipoate-protein ligase A